MDRTRLPHAALPDCAGWAPCTDSCVRLSGHAWNLDPDDHAPLRRRQHVIVTRAAARSRHGRHTSPVATELPYPTPCCRLDPVVTGRSSPGVGPAVRYAG